MNKKRFNQRTKAVILTVILTILMLVIYAFGFLISEKAVGTDVLNAKRPPSWAHPFGTDNLGRDLLMRTLKGLSVSMTVGLVASCISAVIAVMIGIAAAMGSKLMDGIINWVIDLMMGIPHTVFIILISFSLGRGLKGLLVGIAATHWT
ncbi:MAG: ABC transporter permease, partial [Lachnospiraceae bacterium]|nr:ABC transporter permease [Lachnospiraceae bacterium]